MDEEHAAEEVRDWRIEQLRRLGYGPPQRTHLADLMDRGELDLEQVRHIAEKGATVEEAWWVLS